MFLEALGPVAVEAGMKAAWFALEDLGALVAATGADDAVTRGVELVVVDDIGLLPVSSDAAEGLYRPVDAAYEKRSVAISSNLHPSGFDELMPKTSPPTSTDSCTAPTSAPPPPTACASNRRPPARGVKPLPLSRAVLVAITAQFSWPLARSSHVRLRAGTPGH